MPAARADARAYAERRFRIESHRIRSKSSLKKDWVEREPKPQCLASRCYLRSHWLFRIPESRRISITPCFSLGWDRRDDGRAANQQLGPWLARRFRCAA